jgi:UDP-N-acetyl-2-amino-2-deoxyglucuronate dehydrogenase
LDTVRLALVGCGRIGQRHLQALIHCAGVDLAAVVDHNADKAEAAALAFDAVAYTDVSSLLKNSDMLDGLIVATPSSTHRSIAEAGLRAGLNVLVERPLALCVEDAQALVDLARSHDLRLAVSHFNRLVPSVSHALDTLRAGRLGRLVGGSAALRWSRPQSFYDAASWRRRDGGVLFNQALHLLDILLHFSGPIREVFAYADTLTHHIESEDTATAVLRAENGALLTLNATTSVHHTDLEERLVVIGDMGSVVLGPSLHQVQAWRVAGDDEESLKAGSGQTAQRASWQNHLEALEDFVSAIRGDHPLQLSGESAVYVVRIVQALLRSAEEGRPIRVEGEEFV